MAVEGASHEDRAFGDFIKQDMAVKRPRDHEEAPRGKAGMREPGDGAKQWLASDERAGRLDRCKIALRHIPPARSAYH